jgi:predicted phosphodiesterase
MGNHDEFLLDAALVYRYTEDPLIAASVDWCRAQLSRDDLDFIRGFERRMRMELAPGVSALLYHGSPASHLDDLLATTSPEELDRLMSGHVADIMVGGHTHVQMVRQHHGSLLLNPGSVGLAFKDFPEGREPTLLTHAEYALARADEKGISVTVRRVAFDVKAHREAIACTDHPMRDWLLGQYR